MPRDSLARQVGRQRCLLVDVIKGVAIFLMLWGHCIQCCYRDEGDFFQDEVFKIIYSFHMPLLMIVSGYLFGKTYRHYDIDQLLSRKALSLIKPIIGGSIFLFFFTTALDGLIGGLGPVAILNGAWLGDLNSLWFLWSVLGATTVMCVAMRYSKKRQIEFIIVLLGIVFVAFLPNWQMNVYMYPYFVIGHYYAKYKERLQKIEWIKYISLVAFPIMMVFFEKKHYIYTSSLYGSEYSLGEYVMIDTYRWAIGLVGCVFVITVIQLLLKCDLIKRISVCVSKLGKNSLQIYVFSVVFLSNYLPRGMHLIRKIGFVDKLYQVFSTNAVLYDLVFTLIIAVLYAVALYYLTKILEKLKISKLIFGR